MSQMRVAIQKRERLIQAIKTAMKLQYQPQRLKAFAHNNKAMQSRFEDLELQNASIGKLKMHMSAFQDENEIQPCLDLEEQKRCIDEIIVNKEKWLQSQIANGEDLNEEENTAANQGLLQNNGSSR